MARVSLDLIPFGGVMLNRLATVVVQNDPTEAQWEPVNGDLAEMSLPGARLALRFGMFPQPGYEAYEEADAERGLFGRFLYLSQYPTKVPLWSFGLLGLGVSQGIGQMAAEALGAGRSDAGVIALFCKSIARTLLDWDAILPLGRVTAKGGEPDSG
jgi:hypothetical protein